MSVSVPISPGELLDKISILEVKLNRFPEGEKKEQVRKEWATLSQYKLTLGTTGKLMDSEVMDLYLNLRLRNQWLFDCEDVIRREIQEYENLPEHQSDEAFAMADTIVDYVKLIHKYNRQRAEYKAEINRLFNSDIMEAKEYHGE